MNSSSHHSLRVSKAYEKSSRQYSYHRKQESIINHSVSTDYNYSYYPRYSSISPTNAKSPTYLNESSSGVDMSDEESMESHSFNSEPRIIRYYNSSIPSPSACSRQVIIKPASRRTVKIIQKPREQQTRRKTFLYEKELINKKRSSVYFSRQKYRYSSLKHEKNTLKRLYEEYSNENVYRDWKPLPLIESRELYQYALDKYHQKSFSN